MRISEGRVGDCKTFVITQSLRKPFGSLVDEDIAPSAWRCFQRRTIKWTAVWFVGLISRAVRQLTAWIHPLETWANWPVDRGIRQVRELTRATVSGAVDLREVGLRIELVRCDVAINKVVVVENVHQERNIGCDPTDTELG